MPLLRSIPLYRGGWRDYKDFAPTEHIFGPVKCPNSSRVAYNASELAATLQISRTMTTNDLPAATPLARNELVALPG